MGATQLEMLTLIEQLRSQGEDFCTVTVVRTADATSAKAGAKAVITSDGVLHGFVGGSCVQGATKRAALQALASEAPRLIRVKPNQTVAQVGDENGESVTANPLDHDGVELHKSGCPSGGTVDLFLEPYRQQSRLVICGTSPVALSLARLAQAMGYRTTIATHDGSGDSLAPTESNGRFEFIDWEFTDFDLQRLNLQPRDAIVVATQGRRDADALTNALRTPCKYVSMVGSRRKLGVMRERLTTDIAAERLADLKGPAGLDIGAIEPEEIALSILCELVEFRRRNLRHSVPNATPVLSNE